MWRPRSLASDQQDASSTPKVLRQCEANTESSRTPVGNPVTNQTTNPTSKPATTVENKAMATKPLPNNDNECPAFGTTCQLCGRQNHFATVCKIKNKPLQLRPPIPDGKGRQTEGAIFDNLCSVTSGNHTVYGIVLDHHLYNNMNDCWIRRASKPQPHISLNATIHPQDYAALGYKPVTST
ncbi:uncharacterized protein LOC114575796, partial [Exaiptasia diaphana]|uniref:Uncharacterized protein n=1 Tax=Exaiptasia diaphana TaxID=2652724 RepID=A0A913YPP7_EXADI